MYVVQKICCCFFLIKKKIKRDGRAMGVEERLYQEIIFHNGY